jgi:hypothetical protein
LWDWPNPQVVREDESGPGVDTGGEAPDPVLASATPANASLAGGPFTVALVGTDLDSAKIAGFVLFDSFGNETIGTGSGVTATSATVDFAPVDPPVSEGVGYIVAVDSTPDYISNQLPFTLDA